jgi:nanoRNase/pAp phosphatase (c-di-AMP/oligoRNAs hydrolase)
LPNYQEYFRHVMALAQKERVETILADPQVAERVAALREHEAAFLAHLKDDSTVDGNVILTDVRGKHDVPTGNRFLIYTLFPEANVSVRIADGFGDVCSIQVGHSILNRTCRTNVGDLLHGYGGGGHEGAGTAQPAKADADRVLAEIIATLHRNG